MNSNTGVVDTLAPPRINPQKVEFTFDLMAIVANGTIKVKEVSMANIRSREATFYKVPTPILHTPHRHQHHPLPEIENGSKPFFLELLLHYIVEKSRKNQTYIAIRGGSTERALLKSYGAPRLCSFEDIGIPPVYSITNMPQYTAIADTFTRRDANSQQYYCSHRTLQYKYQTSATLRTAIITGSYIIKRFGPLPQPEEQGRYPY